MNPIRVQLDSHLMHFVHKLHSSLMLKSSILPQPVPGKRIILKAPEKKSETLPDVRTNTATCAWTHEHHSIAQKVSNWHPGSLTEKYPKPESTITSRVA